MDFYGYNPFAGVPDFSGIERAVGHISEAAAGTQQFIQSGVDLKKETDNKDAYYKKMVGFAAELSQEYPGMGVDPTTVPKPREDEPLKEYTTQTIANWIAQHKSLLAAYNNFQDPESIQKFQTKVMGSQFASKELVDNIQKLRDQKAAEAAQKTLGVTSEQGALPNYQALQESALGIAQYHQEQWSAPNRPDLTKTPEYTAATNKLAGQALPGLNVPGQTSVGATTQAYETGQASEPVLSVAKMYPTPYQTMQTELSRQRNSITAEIGRLRARYEGANRARGATSQELAQIVDDLMVAKKNETYLTEKIGALQKGFGKSGNDRAMLLQEAGLTGYETDVDLRGLVRDMVVQKVEASKAVAAMKDEEDLVSAGLSRAQATQRAKEKQASTPGPYYGPYAPEIMAGVPLISGSSFGGGVSGGAAPSMNPPASTSTQSTSTASSYLEEVKRRKALRGQ